MVAASIAIGPAFVHARVLVDNLMVALRASLGSQDRTLERSVLEAHQRYVATVSDARF